MKNNPYIDESDLVHHVAILSLQEMSEMITWHADKVFAYLCDKAHCHPQQVYRVSWIENVINGNREYILDVDPNRIIHVDTRAS